ncbi:MAG: BadF/BadG/BcrA/BcrD ATPase family protein [Cellulosilyticaceae bacterium]
MNYIIGIDGGGTKTRAILGDLEGHILFDATYAGSNHQHTGLDNTREVLRTLFQDILSTHQLTPDGIAHIYLGLSGADTEEDFDKLRGACQAAFGEVPFTVVNDAFIIMRSGLDSAYGAVAICGTGTNAAARNSQGKAAILRALAYELGSFGGGLDIATEGIHRAFKADERTGPQTVLTTYVPEAFGVATLEEVIPLFYPEVVASISQIGKVTPLIFEGANQRDKVCQDILLECASVVGEQTGGVILQTHMEDEAVPVVIGGSVFGGSNPLFLDQFLLSLHKVAPKAYLVIPQYPPVYGAYLSGLDLLGIAQTTEVQCNLQSSL